MMELTKYLLLLLLLVFICFVLVITNSYLNKLNIYRAQEFAYECGFDSYNPGRIHNVAKFYLIAILYLIFDLELAFILPFSVLLHVVYYQTILKVILVILCIGFVLEKLLKFIE